MPPWGTRRTGLERVSARCSPTGNPGAFRWCPEHVPTALVPRRRGVLAWLCVSRGRSFMVSCALPAGLLRLQIPRLELEPTDAAVVDQLLHRVVVLQAGDHRHGGHAGEPADEFCVANSPVAVSFVGGV